MIRIWMDEEGRIERVNALKTSFSAEVESAAIRAFSAMQFAPGEINGRPVKSVVDIVLEYGDPDWPGH